MPAELKTQTEYEKVHLFLLNQFLRMGFSGLDSEVMADNDVDWHQVERLLSRGCTHDLVVRILL